MSVFWDSVNVVPQLLIEPLRFNQYGRLLGLVNYQRTF